LLPNKCSNDFPGFQSKPWAGISERFQRRKSSNSRSARPHKAGNPTSSKRRQPNFKANDQRTRAIENAAREAGDRIKPANGDRSRE